MESNLRLIDDTQLRADMFINQYGKDGSLLRAYQMVGAAPTNLEGIRLDWEQTNQIEVFNVTFSYDYWLPYFEQNNSFAGEV